MPTTTTNVVSASSLNPITVTSSKEEELLLVSSISPAAETPASVELDAELDKPKRIINGNGTNGNNDLSIHLINDSAADMPPMEVILGGGEIDVDVSSKPNELTCLNVVTTSPSSPGSSFMGSNGGMMSHGGMEYGATSSASPDTSPWSAGEENMQMNNMNGGMGGGYNYSPNSAGQMYNNNGHMHPQRRPITGSVGFPQQQVYTYHNNYYYYFFNF